MPWKVKKGGGTCGATKWAVIKTTDGSTVACHDTKESAQNQVKALYANEADAAAARPKRSFELVTIPNVEILEVGTWQTSTGEFTWTTADLEAACAAYDDPGYWSPNIKIGHIDPRFDGQPCIGRAVNPRLSEDKQTLIVDFAGVPKPLADIMPSAFPGRSIEGEFGLTTATGTKHRFAVTAVALLGATEPAISTLEDIFALFQDGIEEADEAVNAGRGQKVVLSFDSVSRRSRRHPAAAVNVDDVRTAFYESVRTSPNPWAWIREVWAGDDAFLIVDNDEGELYRIPWSEGTDGSVEFGTPEEVQVQYVPAPPDEEDVEEQEGLVLLSRRPTRVQAASTGEGDMDLAVLRERLGLAEDADEETVLAALDERLEQVEEEDPEDEEDPGHEEEPEHETGSHPGAVLIDEQELGELRVAAASGREAREMLQQRDRDAFIQGVVRAGKIKPSNATLRQTLEREYDRDPKAAAAMAEELAVVVPTDEVGHGGEGSSSDDQLYEALFPSSSSGK